VDIVLQSTYTLFFFILFESNYNILLYFGAYPDAQFFLFIKPLQDPIAWRIQHCAFSP